MTNSNKREIGIVRDEYSDIWAERMLVTSMVLWPENIGLVFKLIPNDDVFQDEATRIVYEVVRELYHERSEIKSLSVFQRLRSKDHFGVIRRAKISLGYDEMVPRSTKEVCDTAEGILSLYRRHKANELNVRLNSELSKPNKDSEVAELIYKTYEAITLSGGGNLEKTSHEATKEALEGIDKNMRLKREGKLAGISTGSKKLDEITGGWQEDQVIILAGRTAMGKTAAAIDFMLSAAKSGTPVGFFSMEMPAKQLNFRIAANYTRIPYKRIRSGDLSDEEWKMIESALSDIAKLPIYYFDDVSTKDVRRLEAIATEWRRTKNVGLIFIDYIQYLEMPGGDSGSTDRVTKVSKAVKTMQRNLKIPIIALAQLNRNSEGRGDPRPKLADLKDSGQVEQDGSIVIGLFNPAYYLRQGMKITDELEDGDVPFDEKAYCYYVLKNRDGDVVRVDRYADLATNRFSDYRDFGSTSDVSSPVKVPVKPFDINPQLNHDYARNKVFDRLNEEPPF